MWTHCHICQCPLKLAPFGSSATLRLIASGSGQTLPLTHVRCAILTKADIPVDVYGQ